MGGPGRQSEATVTLVSLRGSRDANGTTVDAPIRSFFEQNAVWVMQSDRDVISGLCQRSCAPISCGVSDFRGADFAFRVEPDRSDGLPVAGLAWPSFGPLRACGCIEDGAVRERGAVMSCMALLGGHEADRVVEMLAIRPAGE